jgi:hypothetical protein
LNNKAKIAAGTSGVGILFLIFHFWHLTNIFTDYDKNDKQEKMLKNATVTIVVTDSTGKKDTMLMEDYLKLQK